MSKSVKATLALVAAWGLVLAAGGSAATLWSCGFEPSEGYEYAYLNDVQVTPPWRDSWSQEFGMACPDGVPFTGEYCGRFCSQACGVVFNTNPAVANHKVWVEGYLRPYGDNEFGLQASNGSNLLTQGGLWWWGGYNHRVYTRDENGIGIAADGLTFIDRQYYHIVLEFDYTTSLMKAYVKAVSQGDTTPLTEADRLTFGGGQPAVAFTPGPIAYASRIGLYGYYSYFDDLKVSDTTLLMQVTAHGHVVLDGYQGDYSKVAIHVQLQPVNGGDTIDQTGLLNADGSFTVAGVVPDRYNVVIKAPAALSMVRDNVSVTAASPDLGTFNLAGGDVNGDDHVTFEDFALLQNNYGQSGPVAATAPVAVAHNVNGVLSAGEWANWYSDPAGDNGTGSVDLVGWGAEVRGNTFYAAFALNPDGPTVAEYNYTGENRIWLSMWLDVDPASDPATGVPAGDSQFDPRAQDIYIELGTDEGTLEGSNGWHSLNLWGHGNDFAGKAPIDGTFAYSDHVVEFSCPVSAILAELPNTDNAIPASAWTVAARGAGYGFGDWNGDITDLKTLTISGVYGQVAIPGYVGDLAQVGANFEFTPTGGGSAAVRSVLLNADGAFRLDNISAGTYTVRITSTGTLGAVLTNVSVASDPVSLGTIELTGADLSGNGRVGFEDFSILQNGYGQTGAAGASALSAAATSGCGALGVILMTLMGLAAYGLNWRKASL